MSDIRIKARFRRPLGFVAVLAALGASILIGLIGGRVAPKPERITVSGDTYTLTSSPTELPGERDVLVAGGVGGGAAVSYLKFDVQLPESGGRLQRAWLWLGNAGGGDLPELIELSRVPDTGWDESRLTAADAPRLGEVVASLSPSPDATSFAFDISGVLSSSGVYGFALTASSGTRNARFVAKEAGDTAPTITLEWNDASGSPLASAVIRPPGFTPSPRGPLPVASPSFSPWASASVSVSAPASSPSPSASPAPECVVGPRLVPTCGTLWGVAPGAHSTVDRIVALGQFEQLVRKPQLIYHAYHRGEQMFPTDAEIAVARDPATPRILFLNWKPSVAWGRIAAGDPGTDRYLDRLAEHLKANFREEFFFTFHHEPENDVVNRRGSGWTARDYAAAFRYVVLRLRAAGVTNAISVMSYMAYIPWNTKPWFPDLYPGDDVVDWVAWDEYSYSDPGYGFGDFAEMMNRRDSDAVNWPGFYNWAARSFPSKPLMLGEWGLWYSAANPGHQAAFFDSARLQLELFPRVKAYVYFETPDAGRGQDSRVDRTAEGLEAFRRLSLHPSFEVRLRSADLSSPAPTDN